MPRFTLVVNGKASKVEAPEDMPLLWVLRDRLEVAGTKYGCGSGICGACTVHLDGQAYRSCQVPISAGRQARHDDRGARRPGPQAGLDRRGRFAVRLLPGRPDHAGRGALGKTPNPGDDEIVAALNDNLCRCGTYLRVRAAIRRAAEVEGKHY